MPTVIGCTFGSPLSDQTREIRLARFAISRLAPGLTLELRKNLICELLGRLSAEKKRREALKLNHWEEQATALVDAIAEELLAERAQRIASHLAGHSKRFYELAWRVTRNADLADHAVAQTAWELWEGRTKEEVSCRALVMNARNLLRDRRRGSRRTESLDCMASAAEARGDILDFPSHRLDDKDPLEILIAREAQREIDDELTYAVRNVRRPKNWWITQTEWWKSSGLAELERTLKNQ